MKSLYRKYRPTKLEDVIGQSQVTDTLASALASGKISHAYLFTGPRGCGKTSVARIFAHAVNNFDYQIEDDYVDIIEIDGASNRGIDDVRELREKATIAPTAGKYKIYIIDEVHMFTKEAFNALLKILEEPPAHVIFIMATTDAHKVPITITSRAQTFTFKLADADTMLEHLRHVADNEKININDDALAIIVRRGGGSFRDSLSLLDQISTLSDSQITANIVTDALGLPQDQQITDLLSAYASADITSVTAILRDILNSGSRPETLAEELVKQIIAEPKPELLSLLAKLTDIKDPFAEAKLLVALAPLQSKELVAEPSGSQSSRPSSRGSAAMSRQQPPKYPEGSTPSSFNWPATLTQIQSSDSSLGAMLTKFQHQLTGNTLTLIAPNKGVHKIVNNDKKRQIITELLPGNIKLVIAEPGTASANAAKDPTLAQISAIMGDVQEVTNGGESPF